MVSEMNLNAHISKAIAFDREIRKSKYKILASDPATWQAKAIQELNTLDTL